MKVLPKNRKPSQKNYGKGEHGKKVIRNLAVAAAQNSIRGQAKKENVSESLLRKILEKEGIDCYKKWPRFC